MAGTTSERQRWIVAQIDLAPASRVLELGCGHGVAGSLLCARLGPDGSYLGIDRSPKMTEAAGRRLADAVAVGRASLVTADIADVRLVDVYDVVVAIHLPVLDRGDPAPQLDRVAGHMDRRSRFHVGFQPLDPGALGAMVDRMHGVLAASGLSVVDVVRGEPAGRPTAVMTAMLSPGRGS